MVRLQQLRVSFYLPMTNPPPANRADRADAKRSTSSQNAPAQKSASTQLEVPKPVENRLYTIKESAYYLNVSSDTIRRAIASGELSYVVVGRRSIRIIPQELRDYVLRNKHRRHSPHPSGKDQTLSA